MKWMKWNHSYRKLKIMKNICYIIDLIHTIINKYVLSLYEWVLINYKNYI